MVKVTISIEGNQEEVDAYLQRIAGVDTRPTTSSISWLPEEIEVLFNNITSDAQTILVEIASNPTGYNRDSLLKKLGIDGRSVAGRLSSVEANRKRLFPSKPRPLDLDDVLWAYEMLPEVAEWIISNRTT
ncbi:hypothetical protein ACFLV6_01135 [Chloroflexota bacterium]